MFWIWPSQHKLQARLIGPQSELLQFEEYAAYGTYHLEPGIYFSWKRRRFKLRVPPTSEVFVEGSQISHEHSADELWLEWKKIPTKIRLKFTNSCELELQTLPQEERLPLPIQKRIGSLAFVFIAHLAVLLLAYGGAKNSLEIAQHKLELRMQERADLQKIEDVSIVQIGADSSGGSGSRTAAAAPDRQMKNLLSSWQVGKPIQSADEILPKDSPNTPFGKKLDLADAKAWRENVDYDLEQIGSTNGLNLSDAEIANAFVPLIPRLKECYDEVLIRDRSLQGRPEMQIEVGVQGKVEDVQVSNLKAEKPESIRNFESCLNKVYARASFSKTPNQAFIVKYTLILQQANAQL